MGSRSPLQKVSRAVISLQKEANLQGFTSYRLAKATGLRIHTMQRLLAGIGSPTIATLDAVAAALGMVIEVKKTTGIQNGIKDEKQI